jgi:hypothetical protein
MARRNSPSSRASIERLKREGYSEAQIGRAVGRDSSLIGQIARGKKPGNNLSAALDNLASGRKVRAPARRKKASGAIAAVRGSRAGAIRPGMKAFIERMEKIAQRNGVAHLEMTWREMSFAPSGPRANMNSIYGGPDRGSSAKSILAKARRYANAHSQESDAAQLEGFLKRELAKANRMNALRGLDHIDYRAFYSARSKSKKSSRRKAA